LASLAWNVILAESVSQALQRLALPILRLIR
jgi:hypothetical protein